jgi:hypothetical protein
MELGDIWVKVAKNQTLTPQEEEFLRLSGRDTQQRNTFVSGNTTANGLLIVPSDAKLIGEYVRGSPATFKVPSGYASLLLLGAINHDTVGSADVFLRFNGDTGNNYYYQEILADDATLTSARTSGADKIKISPFGVVANFTCYISGVNKTTNIKRITSNASSALVGFVELSIIGGLWDSTSVIDSITIDTTFNVVGQSVISIYGFK